MNEALEDLLRRVATGELRADAPDVRAAAQADAEFAHELEATIDVLHRLDAGAAERAHVLRRAGELVDTPGETRVAALVQDRVAEAASRSRRRWWWIAAAAAALLAALAVFTMPLLQSDRDAKLGPGKVRCVTPGELADDFSVFRWDANVAGGWFVVTVTDPLTEKEWSSDPIRGELQWQPPEQDHRAWPDSILWKVQWVDDDGVKGVFDVRAAKRR